VDAYLVTTHTMFGGERTREASRFEVVVARTHARTHDARRAHTHTHTAERNRVRETERERARLGRGIERVRKSERK